MKFTVKVDEVIVITIASILVLIFSATLVKLIRSKEHSKLVVIVVLFIFANLSLVIGYHTFTAYKNTNLVNTWQRPFIAST